MQNLNTLHSQHDVAHKFKEVAKTASEHMKEQIYQASHLNVNKN
jgi:hypothetical protein